ncbi:MAG: hypothetical protein LCH37_03315 [Bacteroidetes bacterium]|nr:hypothetical protein [Bacteroidota bacterium]
MKITYLSYGKYVTGGFLHEKNLAESLFLWIEKQFPGQPNRLNIKRIPRFFETPLAWLKLQWLPFQSNSQTDLFVLVSRMAFPALILAVVFRKKVVLVWHYHDEQDNSGRWLKYYFNKFFLWNSWIRPDNLALVVVSPFWLGYFSKVLKQEQVHVFPNLINPYEYLSYQTTQKKKQIHLGQLSWKNDTSIFKVASQLMEWGYACYFSSTNPEDPNEFKGIPVVKESHTDYLKRMGESIFTLAFPRINEGWNRIAHESFLVKTKVIGLDRGGLGDLLRLGNGVIVTDYKELLENFQSFINLASDYEIPKGLLELNPDRALDFIEPLANSIWRGKKGN